MAGPFSAGIEMRNWRLECLFAGRERIWRCTHYASRAQFFGGVLTVCMLAAQSRVISSGQSIAGSGALSAHDLDCPAMPYAACNLIYGVGNGHENHDTAGEEARAPSSSTREKLASWQTALVAIAHSGYFSRLGSKAAFQAHIDHCASKDQHRSIGGCVNSSAAES